MYALKVGVLQLLEEVIEERRRRRISIDFLHFFFIELIHISKGREVADHCMLYALSDEKDEAFTEQCSHNHQMVCESCEQLKETIAALQKSSSSVLLLRSWKKGWR
ncbi:Hypothetical predicted protein [Mytilus galloprovincialis]|uniref:Uncharacterized protein n=1 Tax=Mytilus galloprovincialis TaxID=29158 RepID=A0A8B6ELM3_MYTGA|nr:Hypothetical predicted protein [Mytilus galloprovincialis]